jgi:ABC-type bacteriocin/lantibiotic exporter with double-glycine peptidase domain
MGPISKSLYKQILGWRVYSVIAPAIFTAIAAFLYLFYGAPFQKIFYAGVIVLGVTCISWWHWSMSTMLAMLGIMKDTDDHFERLSKQLEELRAQNKPHITLVKTTPKPVDNEK